MEFSDFVNACRDLGCEKVTERKKAAEKFERYLAKREIINILDHHHEAKPSHSLAGGRTFTWDNVLKSVCVFVALETQHLQKGKETQSAATKRTRDSKKQATSSRFKLVVRIADRRGPKLKSSTLISHIIEILSDPFTCKAFGLDYSSILLKNVLSTHKYVVEISSDTWHELIGLYCKLFHEPEVKVERATLSAVIAALLAAATGQCDMRPKRLLAFFTKVFSQARHEKSLTVLEHLSSALNMFVNTIAANSRTQICRLGEAIFTSVLYLWDNRPSARLKESLVEFLQTQMRAHHPGGAKKGTPGAFAVDWDLWMSHLRKLYDVLYTELQTVGDRSRFSALSSAHILSASLVDLAADVCQQLFSETSQTIDVTQLTMTGEGDTQGGPRAKKRRIESGWAVVREFILGGGQSIKVTPWLQLLTRLVEKYTLSFPVEQVVPYLTCLSNLLLDCKRGDLSLFITRCIQALADNWDTIAPPTTVMTQQTAPLWMKIWTKTLRTVGLHHAEVSGYSLMSSMIKRKLVVPEKDIWSLFIPAVTLPTCEAVQFLLDYLPLFDLPESYQPKLIGAPGQEKASYPLRRQLIDWLLPGKDEDSEVVRCNYNVNPRLVGRVLVALTLRDPAWCGRLSGGDVDELQYVSSLERKLLATSLDMPLLVPGGLKPAGPGGGQGQTGTAVHLPLLLKKLEDLLARDVLYYCNDTMQFQVKDLEEMVSCLCTVSKVLYTLLQFRVITSSTIHATSLIDVLRQGFKKLSSVLVETCRKEGPVCLCHVLHILKQLFTFDKCENSEASFLMATICRSVTSSRLIDLLLDIAMEKITITGSSSTQHDSSAANKSRLASRRQSTILEDSDDDFDLESGSSSRNGKMEDLEFEEEMEQSQEPEDSTSPAEVCQSVLSESSLSEWQRCRLEAVRLLCAWCAYDKPWSSTQVIKPDLDVQFIKSQILDLIGSDQYNPSKPVDLLLTQTLMDSLTTADQSLSHTSLEIMLEALKEVAKIHRRDQEVCCVCLSLLMKLVPHMKDRDDLPRAGLEECRETVLKLITAFWKLQSQGHCTSAVRLNIAKFMECLVQSDPASEWSRFEVDEADESGRKVTDASSRFIECGADYCHNVRMYVTASVSQLFVCENDGGRFALDKCHQDLMFNQLYHIVSDSLDISVEKLSPDRVRDERMNRTASVLTAMGTVICVSPVCEKKAVFALCQLIREKNIEQETITKVLVMVSRILGYSSSVAYVSDHLSYLLHQWLELKYPLQDFPYTILMCDSNAHFYKKYYDTIVPELMAVGKLAAVQHVAMEMQPLLQMDCKQLLVECVPRVVAYFLPQFAARALEEQADSAQLKRSAARARTCYDLLKQEISREVVDEKIAQCLDDIVVNLLLCLYEEDESEYIRNLDPEPNPPCLKLELVTSAFNYLTAHFCGSSGSSKPLLEQLARTPDSIQKILLKLSVSLASSHRLQAKRRFLLMYKLFTELLLKEFHNQLGGAWAFILRDIVHRLIYLMIDLANDQQTDQLYACYKENVICIALGLLREVCEVAMETCVQELKKYLPLLVSRLISLTVLQGDVGAQSLLLLRYLVVDNANLLQDVIGGLDPFPDQVDYADFHSIHKRLKYESGSFTLKQEVEHFLRPGAHHSLAAGFRLEGLKFLQDQLARHTDHLSRLAIEDGKLLRRLVCRLIHLTKGTDKGTVLEAGKCLGAIGPVNLSAISLSMENQAPGLQRALEAFSELPKAHKYCRIFHLLNEYLTDRSIETVSCASDVLKAMLATKTGMEFMDGYKVQMTDTEFLFHYLHPFRCPKKKSTVAPKSKKSWDTFQSSVDQESLWNPHHSNHERWVQDLTVTLIQSGGIQDELLQLMEPVCVMNTEVCELIVPYLVHDILALGSQDHREVLSRQLANFFSCHCNKSSGRVSRSLSRDYCLYGEDMSVCTNPDSLKTMLDVVEYLRHQVRPKQGHGHMTAWDNNFWLDINYLQVAKAAQYCSAHFTTLLYAEIWCDVQRDKDQRSGSQPGSGSSWHSLSQETRIDSLSGASASTAGASVQELLLEAYRWIGEPDGVYGCGAGKLADSSSRIRTYEHENQWDKAVVTCDIEMSQGVVKGDLGLLQALQNFGTSHVLDTYLRGMIGDDGQDLPADIRELQFEAAWKIGQWNLDTTHRLKEDCGFHQALYTAVRAVREDHVTFARSALDTARLRVLQELRGGGVESIRRLYPVLASLQCTTVVERLIQVLSGSSDCEDISGTSSRDLDNDFEFILPVQNISCSTLQVWYDKTSNREVYTALISQLQTLAAMASEANRPQIAEQALHQLKALEVADLSLQLKGSIEEARSYWARSEHNIAKHLMRLLIERISKLKQQSRVAAKFYPRALSIYGNWLAETRSENPNIIMENYLEKTVTLLEQLGEEEETSLGAYLSLARYADSQYQNIVNYMKSSTFEAKQSLMKKAQSEAERLREVIGSGKDRYLLTLEKQFRIDNAELQTMISDRTVFLVKAVDNYLKCLKCGDQHDLRVFRLASLWFNNADVEDVSNLMKTGVREIKSYKWLPLMYQLAARMDVRPQRGMSEHFLPTVNSIITDCAVTHPHHTLFCVLALANANRDTELLQQGKSSKRAGKLSKSQGEAGATEEGRVQAAKNMVRELRNEGDVGSIVRDMETLCDAYIQLANWGVQQYKAETKAIQLPSALAISKVKNLRNVPVPTAVIKVDPSGTYDTIPYILKFHPTFKLAGGINLPKIITCEGSDGRIRRQLVKGKDDLRQDAVMQQVFEMVNNLLKKNTETRKRQLQIRKYKVIPLSQRSGLLEWCEGTQPVGEYLIGNLATGIKGAHARYRPKDWTAPDCRKYLQGADAGSKCKALQEIFKNFKPVFRHFLLEKFPQPATWFERRLAYTRSMATNSIVGYILGLGDRHVQNILIDCNTAELVHIDLGVAFEQGEILPTPETVPFRLTRDFEDAMGASGVEGVFRRCCEKTMEVMRNNQEAVLTILEVLLYDPLYAWTISPAKAYALQQRRDRSDPDTLDVNTSTADIMDMAESSTVSSRNSETQENVNKLAGRVLLRLHQKLQGLEDGIQLSLSGQVNHLIQEARDPENLSRLFPGWQPYI